MSMKALRCVGLLLVVLLSACDAQDPPAPKPKVAAEAAQTKVQAPAAAPPAVETSGVAVEPAKPPVHDLSPNVSVVPVTAGGEAASGKSATPAKPQVKASPKSTADNKREAAAKKSVAASKKVVKDTSLSNAKLDLSLPPELAREVAKEKKPNATARPLTRKPILPQMFGDKDDSSGQGPFELNGRLLSNEMQLQMRNDNRRDVEGAALDFKFKQ
jgi:glucose/arabinose dehydrogenase